MTTDPTPHKSPHESALLRWIDEMTPYGVLVTDENCRIQSWNHWLETQSGHSEASLLGQDLFTVYPDLVERGLDKRFHQALHGEVNILATSFHKYLLPFPSPLPEAACKWMLQTARIAPLYEGDRCCGTVILIEDVTLREHQAHILRRQFRRQQLLSAASESLLLTRNPTVAIGQFLVSLTQHLRAKAFAIYLRQHADWTILTHGGTGPAEEWLGDLPTGFLNACTNHVVRDNLPVIRQEPSAQERTTKALAGSGFFCRSLLVADNFLGTLILIPEEGSAGFTPEDLELIKSVSQYIAAALDREQARQALVDAHQNLESKVIERTIRLEESVQLLESFSYSVAHDLRAPIRAIKGYGDILLEDFAKEISKPARGYLARIRIAAVRMELLTKDLLSFCQVSRESIHPTPVNLEEIILETSLVLPALQNEGVLSNKNPLGYVKAHPSMLRQAVMNFLDNAIKFKHPDRPLKIVVRTEPSGRHRTKIWIEDNGIGISPEYHEKIFGIFERLHHNEDKEGSGIGLAIVAKSIQRMGGSCGVESTLGEGSRFWIELASAHHPKPT